MSVPAVRVGAPARLRASAVMQLSGGALIVAGVFLPWLTVFAGLQAYSGIIGWNGRAILAAGVIVVLGGLASLVGRASVVMQRSVSVLAALVAGGATVLLLRLIEMWRQLVSHDAMMVARPGVGLPVVVAGAVVAAAAIVFSGD